MRHLLLPLILLCSLAGAAIAADTAAKADPAKVEATKPLSNEITESGKTAQKAMDDFRAYQLAILKGEPVKEAKTVAETPDGIYAKAQHDCLVDFFAPAERRTPSTGKTAADVKMNTAMGSYPWQSNPTVGQEAGLLYAQAHKIVWLEDICSGGAKRYANDEYTKEAARQHREKVKSKHDQDPKTSPKK